MCNHIPSSCHNLNEVEFPKTHSIWWDGDGDSQLLCFYPSSLSNQTNNWQNPFLCEKKKSSNFHVEKVYGKNQLKLPENR